MLGIAPEGAQWSAEAMTRASTDCVDFLDYVKAVGLASAINDFSPEAFGVDLWLSRNGHGAGFFDRDYRLADALQKAARSMGPRDLYCGDDGLMYLS